VSAIQSTKLPPLSLYIHIPWCVKKCPYCDFNSHTANGALPERDYVAALLQDLKQEIPGVQQRKLSSIFFGGGTPSLFSAAAIETLLDASKQLIGWEKNIEISLEANPGTADEQNFTGFRRAGVNRLSLGVQSFDDRFLKKLGRIHSAEEARRAVGAARNAGFDTVNLDLMYGLPGQTTDQSLADLQSAIQLQPEHISWYELTLEPNTEFYKRPPQLPQESAMDSIEASGRVTLQQAGYARYEISAYAKPGRQSRHNCNYWEFGDYIGIGAGAHGKISTDTIERKWKTRVPSDYMAAGCDPLAGRRQLTAEQLPLEFMMNTLRLTDGVPASYYQQRTGGQLARIEPTLKQLRQRGLLQQDPERICTTTAGSQFLDSVLQAFID
jgi:oxygen-independent coproporphyrinogen-3 oxidase